MNRFLLLLISIVLLFSCASTNSTVREMNSAIKECYGSQCVGNNFYNKKVVKDNSTKKRVKEVVVKPKRDQLMEFKKKWYDLGQFYRKVYISELVFDSVVEVEKIKSGYKMFKYLENEKIIKDCNRRLKIKSINSDSTILEFKATKYNCVIENIDKFFNCVFSNKYLDYFKLKKKVGSYWVYIDTAKLTTFEIFFYLAYFTEEGLEPEYDNDLGYVVLGHFQNIQDALLLKKKYPEIDLKVNYVVYRKYLPEINIKQLQLK